MSHQDQKGDDKIMRFVIAIILVIYNWIYLNNSEYRFSNNIMLSKTFWKCVDKYVVIILFNKMMYHSFVGFVNRSMSCFLIFSSFFNCHSATLYNIIGHTHSLIPVYTSFKYDFSLEISQIVFIVTVVTMIYYSVTHYTYFRHTILSPIYIYRICMCSLHKIWSFWKINSASLILKIYLPNLQGTPWIA